MQIHFTGLEIAYDDVGQGLPLVLIHGFPVDRRIWKPQMTALAARCRIIAIDLPGHGESTATADYSIESLATLLAAFFDRLGLERPVLLGYSMGGSIALEFARAHPDKLRGLVLYAARAVADTPEESITREALAEVAGLLDSQPIVAEEVMIDLQVDPAIAAGGEMSRAVREMVSATPRLTFKQGLLALAHRQDYTDLLPSIPCPTLAIVGEYDPITPPTFSQAMVARIPNARLAILPSAGHFANLEAPEAFNGVLEQFLSTIDLQP